MTDDERSAVDRLRRCGSGEAYPSSTIRLSSKYRQEVDAMAKAMGLSLNAFIAIALDEFMQRKGRRPLEEIDPEFVNYLSRKRKND